MTGEPCDCGKGEWCPQFGVAFAQASGRIHPRRFEPDALEVSLSKSDGAHMTSAEMTEFLADLSTWAESMATKGYRIVSEPAALPGTMYWRAKS